ncbi:MAG: polysaccharide pyruvyl transferase family protein [Patescibacteria group bacterium]|jgi:polysaccharide pyruvyl transferase WcaK-like protein
MKRSARQPRTIHIAHIHVWDQNNKGDRGIVLAVQEQLRAVWPAAEIIDFPVEVLKKYDGRQLARLNRADFIVLGGGGIFYSYFLPFDKRMINAIRVPLVIYGAGYIREVGARPLSSAARASLLYLVNKARFVGVRENYTKRFLVRYGAKPGKIQVIGDPALCLSEVKPPRRARAKKLDDKTNFRLGLNLNYSGWLGFGQWRSDILQSYRAVARYFQEQYGAQVYYLRHHPGEDQIYSELKIKGLKVIDFEPHRQKGFYSSLDLVIGMMLHSCVMAVGAGTPEINVAYDLRNRNFARFIGCPELVVEVPELASGELLRRAKLVVARQVAYRKKFLTIRSRVAKRSTEFIKEIKNNLNL